MEKSERMRDGWRRIFGPPETEKTQSYYAGLMKGEVHKHHPWGKAARFNSEKALRSPSVRKYFTAKVAPLLRDADRVLDAGCGPGTFLPAVSPLCGELVGVDVSSAFVMESHSTVARFGLRNTTIVQGKTEALPFPASSFDVVLVVDVLHHLYRLEESVTELKRVLKPDGRMLVFEPNILNPLLSLMSILDRNEWGSFLLCRKGAYTALFEGRFRIEALEYNGLVIGPDQPLFLKMADLLNRPALRLRWLNPKIFVSLKNA